jgi:terminase, large subunit
MPEAARQMPLTRQVFPLLRCLPAPVRQRLSGRSVVSERQPSLHLPHSVRRFVRTPERISPAEFAARHRIVTDGAHQGPWRQEHAPHTVKILELFSAPHVREIWMCGVDQSGKTITLTNCLAWACEHLSGDIFYLMPSEETAKNIVDQKLRPMFEQSKHLRGFLSPRKDDTALTRIRLANGKIIRPSWAGSPAAMATWSAQCCFGDEVDKFPVQAGQEADPITLIRKRARTFAGRAKMFFASTPAGRFIRPGTMACHQVWEGRIRCFHCQQLVRLEGDNLILPEKVTVEEVERLEVTVACNQCGATLTEQQRLHGIRTGGWQAIKGADLLRPEKVGFIHRAWECLDVSLREIAVAWVKRQQGVLTDKIAWANGIEAEDYEHIQIDREEAYILRLVDADLPRGVVPEGTAALLMVVDTQKRGFFYQIWARSISSPFRTAMIDHGFVQRFSDITTIATRVYTSASGQSFTVFAGFIDSGGGVSAGGQKHSRTTAVYEFCRRSRKLFRPIKGKGLGQQSHPWLPKKIDFYPGPNGKKVPIQDGPTRFDLAVNHWKDDLSEALMVDPGSSGGISFHVDTGPDFARQMCAEYHDGRVWVCPNGKPNHHWDCATYLRAALDISAESIRKILASKKRKTSGIVVHSKGVEN